MRAAVIVELHPFTDTRAGLITGLPGIQIDALVFQRAPQSLDDDVVQIGAISGIYGGALTCPLPGKSG